MREPRGRFGLHRLTQTVAVGYSSCAVVSKLGEISRSALLLIMELDELGGAYAVTYIASMMFAHTPMAAMLRSPLTSS